MAEQKITSFYNEKKPKKNLMQEKGAELGNKSVDGMLKNLSLKIEEITKSISLLQEKQTKMDLENRAAMKDLAETTFTPQLKKCFGETFEVLSSQVLGLKQGSDKLNSQIEALKKMVKNNMYNIQSLSEENDQRMSAIVEKDGKKEDDKSKEIADEIQILKKDNIRFKNMFEHQTDDYYWRTIRLTKLPFYDLKKQTPRECANKILRTIGAQHLLHHVIRISFSPCLKNLRLTFSTKDWAKHAIRHMVSNKNYRKYIGGDYFSEGAGVMTFVGMVPKRYKDSEKKLYDQGLLLKKSGVVKHFYVFPFKNSLAMRCIYRDKAVGSKVHIISNGSLVETSNI